MFLSPATPTTEQGKPMVGSEISGNHGVNVVGQNNSSNASLYIGGANAGNAAISVNSKNSPITQVITNQTPQPSILSCYLISINIPTNGMFETKYGIMIGNPPTNANYLSYTASPRIHVIKAGGKIVNSSCFTIVGGTRFTGPTQTIEAYFVTMNEIKEEDFKFNIVSR
jgi:hypothetical protein